MYYFYIMYRNIADYNDYSNILNELYNLTNSQNI